MDCTVQYTDNKQINVLIRTFSGTVTAKDIKNSWQHVFNSGLLHKNHIGVISDFQESDFQIENDDYNYFRTFLLDYFHLIGHLKLVQVIDSPKIALPMAWKLDLDKFNYASFTLEEAKKWIVLSKS